MMSQILHGDRARRANLSDEPQSLPIGTLNWRLKPTILDSVGG